MSVPVIKTSTGLNQAKELLGKSVPMYRKAYSDRTAWLMACFAELVYMKFNPPIINPRLATSVEKMLDKSLQDTRKLKNLVQLAIDNFAYDHEEEKRLLEEQLAILEAELVKTFNAGDSQAMLIKTNKFLVLSFRGTEPTQLKDIKTDARANLTKCVTEGKVHSGFHDAFNLIELEVNQSLSEFAELPLFVTGHSLGGALATIAAKRIAHIGGNAACYTYGAPRVSDDHWLMTMKTPIYRVVNSSDGVTMVPPPGFTITAISWLVGFIPAVGDKWKSFSPHQRLIDSGFKIIHGLGVTLLTSAVLAFTFERISRIKLAKRAEKERESIKNDVFQSIFGNFFPQKIMSEFNQSLKLGEVIKERVINHITLDEIDDA